MTSKWAWCGHTPKLHPFNDAQAIYQKTCILLSVTHHVCNATRSNAESLYNFVHFISDINVTSLIHTANACPSPTGFSTNLVKHNFPSCSLICFDILATSVLGKRIHYLGQIRTNDTKTSTVLSCMRLRCLLCIICDCLLLPATLNL